MLSPRDLRDKSVDRRAPTIGIKTSAPQRVRRHNQGGGGPRISRLHIVRCTQTSRQHVSIRQNVGRGTVKGNLCSEKGRGGGRKSWREADLATGAGYATFLHDNRMTRLEGGRPRWKSPIIRLPDKKRGGDGEGRRNLMNRQKGGLRKSGAVKEHGLIEIGSTKKKVRYLTRSRGDHDKKQHHGKKKEGAGTGLIETDYKKLEGGGKEKKMVVRQQKGGVLARQTHCGLIRKNTGGPEGRGDTGGREVGYPEWRSSEGKKKKNTVLLYS